MLEQKIKPWTFATVISAKKMSGSGFKTGDEVFVMSTKDVAHTKTDPYLKRTLVIVAKVIGNTVLIPNDKNDYEAYVIDPRNLEPVPKARQKELIQELQTGWV